jgi:hypothetical protein
MSDPISDLKRELLAAAERQHGHAPAPRQRRLSGLRVGAPRRVRIGAAVAVAAAVALLLTAPWNNSPSFLEKAEAALTTREGTILHEKWVEIDVSAHPRCTVRRTGEFWIDAYSKRLKGRAFRARVPYLPYPRPPIDPSKFCSPGGAYEVGGVLGHTTIRFVRANRLVRASPSSPCCGLQTDPVGDLRRAIRAGNAYDEGKTKRDGRTVERIRLSDCPPSNPVCPDGPTYAYAYVDPDTFYPVEIDEPGIPYVPGYSDGTPSTFTRFIAFEYLPRTPANLALTSIRAQHPHARVVG